MFRVYLAGPIHGRTRVQILNWRQEATVVLSYYSIGVLDPTRGRPLTEDGQVDLMTNDELVGTLAYSETVVKRDRHDVMTCDGMLVMFDGGPTSRGTMIEIGWADAWNKPIVGIIQDNLRTSFRQHPFYHLLGASRVDVEGAAHIMASFLGC